MKYFLRLNVSDILGSVKCPVMALNGTKDAQVDCGRNLSLLRQGLSGGYTFADESSVNVVKAETGLNHLFQHCRTGEVSEYKEIEETFSPDVLTEMIAWLHLRLSQN